MSGRLLRLRIGIPADRAGVGSDLIDHTGPLYGHFRGIVVSGCGNHFGIGISAFTGIGPNAVLLTGGRNGIFRNISMDMLGFFTVLFLRLLGIRIVFGVFFRICGSRCQGGIIRVLFGPPDNSKEYNDNCQNDNDGQCQQNFYFSLCK